MESNTMGEMMSNLQTDEDIQRVNEELKELTPLQIIKWALEYSRKPIVTTNFRPYEICLLHAMQGAKSDIKVIWCDTGYNTPATYKHAIDSIKLLNLNIYTYVPKQSVAYRNEILGLPEPGTVEHDLFTEQVKLEPFGRAMKEHQPDFWFCNLRKGQTAFRDSIGIMSKGKDGVIKISPFYHFSDEDLDQYILEHKLTNEHNYFDPTKVFEHRECGLHQ